MKKSTLNLLIALYTEALEKISNEENVFIALDILTNYKVQNGICYAAKYAFGDKTVYNEIERLSITDNNGYFGITPVYCCNIQQMKESLQARIDIMNILLIDEELNAMIEDEAPENIGGGIDHIVIVTLL